MVVYHYTIDILYFNLSMLINHHTIVIILMIVLVDIL